MKKYVVKIKRNGHTFGEYESPEEASEKLVAYIKHFNERSDGDGYISRFDFSIEEVENTGLENIVTEYEHIKKVLGVKKNAGNVSQRKYVARPFEGINKKHIEALMALNQLFTIAEAWNKKDRFVPDFRNQIQVKCYPWFQYDSLENSFIYDHTSRTLIGANACLGSRLCFKTAKRAEQFGKQFIELYNKVLLITNK